MTDRHSWRHVTLLNLLSWFREMAILFFVKREMAILFFVKCDLDPRHPLPPSYSPREVLTYVPVPSIHSLLHD